MSNFHIFHKFIQVPKILQGVGGMVDTQPKDPELPALKPEDMQYFDKLLTDVDESTLTKEERNEREIMTYLLKIKNGTPAQRKRGLRSVSLFMAMVLNLFSHCFFFRSHKKRGSSELDRFSTKFCHF